MYPSSSTSSSSSSSNHCSPTNPSTQYFYEYQKDGVKYREEMHFGPNHGNPSPIESPDNTYYPAFDVSQPTEFHNDFGQYFVNSANSYIPPSHQQFAPTQSMFGSFDATYQSYPSIPELKVNQENNSGFASRKSGPKKPSIFHRNSVCSNPSCGTRETTLWRRTDAGAIECNACSLYFRKNHIQRPAELCNKTILKRNRRPRAECVTKNNGQPLQDMLLNAQLP